MGRCTYAFRPRFYCFQPLPPEDDPTSAATTVRGHTVPHFFGTYPDNDAAYSIEVSSLLGGILKGAMLSTTSASADVTTTLINCMQDDTTMQESSVVLNGTHDCAALRTAEVNSESATATDGYLDRLKCGRISHEAGSISWAASGITATKVNGTTVADLAGCLVWAPNETWVQWPDTSGGGSLPNATARLRNTTNAGHGALTAYGDPIDIPGLTLDSGEVFGGLTIFPLPPVETHTGNGTVRRMRIPMDMRVHGVILSHNGHGGGTPTLKLRNNTTSTDITATRDLDTAAPANPDNETFQCIPGTGNSGTNWDFAGQGTERDLSRDDEVDLVAASVTGTISGAQAALIVSTKGFFNPTEMHRDWAYSTTATADGISSQTGRKAYREHHAGVSGPATGGYAFIPIGPFNKNAAGAEELVFRIAAPFDCQVMGFYLGDRTAPTDDNVQPAYRLENSTKTTRDGSTANILSGLGQYYDTPNRYYMYPYGALAPRWTFSEFLGTGSMAGVAAYTNRDVLRGDNLDIYCTTTSGTGNVDQAMGAILVRVTGHLGHSAALD